jgi:hypothetical protein
LALSIGREGVDGRYYAHSIGRLNSVNSLNVIFRIALVDGKLLAEFKDSESAALFRPAEAKAAR